MCINSDDVNVSYLCMYLYIDAFIYIDVNDLLIIHSVLCHVSGYLGTIHHIFPAKSVLGKWYIERRHVFSFSEDFEDDKVIPEMNVIPRIDSMTWLPPASSTKPTACCPHIHHTHLTFPLK